MLFNTLSARARCTRLSYFRTDKLRCPPKIRSNCPFNIRADIRADIRTAIGEIADIIVQLSVFQRVSALTQGYPCQITSAVADILIQLTVLPQISLKFSHGYT